MGYDCNFAKSLPAHRRIDIDSVALLVKRAINFSDWAAGEGICPEMSYHKPDVRQEKNPDEFLGAYSQESLDDEYLTVADKILEAFRSFDEENGRLKCEINHLSWVADKAKRERDCAEKCLSELLARPAAWVGWGGGRCPVSRDVDVTVLLRSGEVFTDITGGGGWALSWRHSGDDRDIIAYSLGAEPAP